MEAEKAMILCKLCLTDCPELETSTLQSCNCVFCVQVRAMLNKPLSLKVCCHAAEYVVAITYASIGDIGKSCSQTSLHKQVFISSCGLVY